MSGQISGLPLQRREFNLFGKDIKFNQVVIKLNFCHKISMHQMEWPNATDKAVIIFVARNSF